MKFQFNEDDKPQGESKEYELLEPGWYDFEIVACYSTDPDGNDLVASNGVPYLKMKCVEQESSIVLHHALFLDEEQSRKVYYFLVATDNEPKGGEIDIVPDMFVGKKFRGKTDIKKGRNAIIRANPKPHEQPEKFEPKEYDEPVDPDLEEDVPF